MRRITSVALALGSGAAFGIAFVLACSGDNHSMADAGCSCPASEPPLAGRLITVQDGPVTIQPGTVNGAGVGCPTGSQLITGSCTNATLNPTPGDLVLIRSGFVDDPPKLPLGWVCDFKNNGTTPVDVKATVICLKPAT